MKAPIDACGTDIIWAACNQVVTDPKFAVDPDIIKQIEFDNDVLFTLWSVLNLVYQNKMETKAWQTTNPPAQA